ncbi:hypothetical protein, partial [Isoptericola halotolerans]
MTTNEAPHRSSPPSVPPPRAPPPRVPSRGGRRVETLAVLWWLAGLALALVLRGTVGPAVAAPEAINHGLLRDVSATTLAGGVVALAALGSLLAVWMRAGRPTGRGARVVLVGGTSVVLLACLLLVDATVLAGLGYLPALVVTSAFSAEVREALGYYGEPAFLLQAGALGGAVLLAVATVRSARRGRGACERCGRRHDGVVPAWT